MTGEFPAQRASNAENVSIWWRHHEMPPVDPYLSMLGCKVIHVSKRGHWYWIKPKAPKTRSWIRRDDIPKIYWNFNIHRDRFIYEWAMSQPMEVDVTHVTSSLIGWYLLNQNRPWIYIHVYVSNNDNRRKYWFEFRKQFETIQLTVKSLI